MDIKENFEECCCIKEWLSSEENRIYAELVPFGIKDSIVKLRRELWTHRSSAYVPIPYGSVLHDFYERIKKDFLGAETRDSIDSCLILLPRERPGEDLSKRFQDWAYQLAEEQKEKHSQELN